MLNHKTLVALIGWLSLLSVFSQGAQARGLYGSSRQSMVTSSVSVHLKPLYMFNDMDVFRFALQDAQYAKCVGMGGLLEVAYSKPFSTHALVRTSGVVGYVHGDASVRQNPNKGHYRGAFGEVACGLEYYPFQDYGLYLYGGLGLQINNVTVLPERKQHNSYHVLPIMPIEVGYKFHVSKRWYIGAAVSGHIGLVDSTWGNMDDYGDYQESHFPDGYVSFSFLVAYHWGGRKWRYSKICNCMRWM